MMAGMLKEEQHQLALEFRGDGPIGRVVVDARADGSARGYVGSPHIGHRNGESGSIDVGASIGKEGFLHILRDTGEEEAYRGTVPLINGEVGSDITYYFLQSEQTPSSVGVGVLLGEDGGVLSAGGFILQLMPGADEEVIDKLEGQIQQMDSVVKQIESGVPLPSIMHALLGDTYNIVEERPLSFRCTCTLRRVERALLSLGAEELHAIVNEQGMAEIFCDFCREPYRFDKQALLALADSLG
jgi:molecular chaperone Hsp33